MKKLFPFVFLLICITLLSACTAKEKTQQQPALPLAFQQRADVHAGDFSYACEICRDAEKLFLTVLSTNAQGMTMTYDGSNMHFSFAGMTNDVPKDAIVKTNILMVLYDAFSVLSGQENIAPSAVKEGFRYQGKIPLGDFVLIVDEQNRLKSFSMKSIDMEIQFT